MAKLFSFKELLGLLFIFFLTDKSEVFVFMGYVSFFTVH